MKVQKAACAAGKEAKEFCGVISDQFKVCLVGLKY